MNILYAQLVGAAAFCVIVLSVQFKKKKNIMIFQMIANALYAMQYILLKAFTAASLNIVTVLRCLSFYKYDKNNKNIPRVLTIIFVLLTIIIGLINYKSLIDFIPIIITLTYTISASFKDPNKFRIAFIVCSFVWIIYNFTAQAYVSIFGNICEIVSTISALNRYKKKQ